MGEILTNDGFEVVDLYVPLPSVIVQKFNESQSDVLFIEPGAFTFDAPRGFVLLQEAMAGKPIVLCSASHNQWFDFCNEQKLPVVVTGNCVTPPKYSYKAEIEQAMSLTA